MDPVKPRLTVRDMCMAAVHAVRASWTADRRGVLTVVGLQLTTAVGLAGALLLLRGMVNDVMTSVDGSGTGVDLGRLIPGVIVLVALGAAGGILQMLSGVRQQILTDRVDRHVISLVLGTAAHTGLLEFEDPDFHDRLQRAVHASRRNPAMVVMMLVEMLQAALTVLAIAGVFITIAWWLLPLATLSALPLFKAAKDRRNAVYAMHHSLAENHRRRQYLEQLLTCRDEAKEIRALNLGATLHARWDTEYAQELTGMTRLIRTHAGREIRAKLLSSALILGVIASVWTLVNTGMVSLAAASTGLAGLWLLSSRIGSASQMLNSVGQTLYFFKDLHNFAAAGAEPPPALTEPASPFRTLRARGVTFTYPGAARPTLHGVDISLHQGEIIALVGANGSGKTTLAKILAGLYAPTGGTLVRDGDPATDLYQLRHGCAVVFQDFVRYKLTAHDNIAFGRIDDQPDDSRIGHAAEAAGVSALLESLPNGYHTVLGREFTDGTDLSGGQWQKLAIARAFYRDAPFVILDEPTAALDPQAEADLFARIRHLFAGRTVLLISHRFSSVRSADRIYVLDSGRVIEHGTHTELMRTQGRYAELFLTQAAGYLDAAPA
ncbi:ABC transporter ATP-binding protein [Kibdelosporangium persicum]|uniref:Lipid A export ATP-binding/permease protein msbA n=1 Tax=Kibdelosporangium persicum TaxID=2698649 RepID=A0ABX2FFR0_9PSEU|nr:ABC transporter ATP-binding protein [Kibdelosporangium persicum]NRN70226.1 Lipid A export ATP-binding/permease protein msbA [Kibdelosporangium persicum]